MDGGHFIRRKRPPVDPDVIQTTAISAVFVMAVASEEELPGVTQEPNMITGYFLPNDFLTAVVERPFLAVTGDRNVLLTSASKLADASKVTDLVILRTRFGAQPPTCTGLFQKDSKAVSTKDRLVVHVRVGLNPSSEAEGTVADQ